MKDDRDSILQSLRQAPSTDTMMARPVLPPSPVRPTESIQTTVDVFITAAKKNSAIVTVIDDATALPSTVMNFLQTQHLPPRIVCEESLLSSAWADTGIEANYRAAKADDACGVTRVIAAAADLGAMLVSDAVTHALTISLIPSHHIAVLRAADIVADLPALWQRLPTPIPRGCHLICGPSRTADIEQTLTLGAHGPITVLVVIIL